MAFDDVIVEYDYDRDKKLLDDMNDSKIQIYFIEKCFLQKINENVKYLPCLNLNSNSLLNSHFDSLINQDVIIILLGSKLIYGFFKIRSILSDSNDELFNRLIAKYNIVKIPKLFFVSFDCINLFKYKITTSEINKKFNSDPNYTKIKINLEYKPICMIQNPFVNIHYYLNLFVNEQENLLNNHENKPKSSKSNTDTNVDVDIDVDADVDVDIDMNMGMDVEIDEYANVPILWNSCDEIKQIIKMGVKKKTIMAHLTNCEKCEIIDNNINKLDMKKKIVLNMLNNQNQDNLNIFNSLIENYSTVKKFKYTNKLFSNLEINIDLNNINIILMENNIINNIYSQCYFIITK